MSDSSGTPPPGLHAAADDREHRPQAAAVPAAAEHRPQAAAEPAAAEHRPHAAAERMPRLPALERRYVRDGRFHMGTQFHEFYESHAPGLMSPGCSSMRPLSARSSLGHAAPSAGEALTISPAFGSGQVLCIPCPDKRSREDVRLGVVVYTAWKLDVPEICVVLTWTSSVTATYVISVHDTGVDWLDEHGDDNLTCDDCGDACEDADLRLEANARDQNCIRCNPCSLCARCSVRIDDAKVCLTCVTDSEAEHLPNIKQRRRRLVEELWEQRR